MHPVPFRERPAFRAVLFAIALAATWGYDAFILGGWRASLGGLILDLFLSFILVQGCLFFYAQFTLPVSGMRDRLKVFRHLSLHMRGAHGAAVFIRNGRKVERRGESRRAGPGLLWIDTASAVLVRNENGPKSILGPGIHFLESTDRMDSTFSLHRQTYSIGPGQDEPVFEKLPEDAGEEQRRRHAATQARRQAVTGLTRDGNEVVPEIRVLFKLDGAPAKAGHPGSRFGFARESVERASRGQGVNVDPVTGRRVPVAWNQLPGLIAVDLWREYLAKFTLDDLFSAEFEPAPEVLQPQEPTPVETRAAPSMELRLNWPAQLLKSLNDSIESGMQRHGMLDEAVSSDGVTSRPDVALRQRPGLHYTGLQIIAHMVRARMMHAAVPILDDCGRYLKGHIVSEEYRRLRERGLRVMDVTLGGYRFDPAVEEQIVQQWRSSWQANAITERGRVEQLEVLAAESGKQRALLEHAGVLGSAIMTATPASVPAALKTLLRASQAELLSDERLHGRGSAALEQLSVLARWVESPDHD